MRTYQPNEIILVVILTLVVLASGVDLMSDLSEGATLHHIFKEAVVVAISVTAIIWILVGLHKQTQQIEALKQELAEAQQPSAAPSESVLAARRQLALVVAQQFQDWALTQSEQEVGWLLIKGLSLKEISQLRATSEKTVRQQASSIYKKADLPGRHAFSGWFIEDLL